ncbi:hypothetical protein KR52_05305 [Synechococcus sp. KORDI-52]|uniref:hypothetical protein n=1 Tax=Synechococcus sp. KORDI-52 TaxID=585425 RepID=UPI0004E0982A|nr:hypothetical protein [Synechococcus sp. KORDI-52]AII48562.1 hypothetical protein KR52_05305 [Synechococcus sp. KORDI-52]
MASSTEIPLVTLLPRAWIGFSRGPWRCVGLAALVLISASGPAVVGHDLRLAGSPWLNRLGDLSVLVSLVLPLLPILALLQFTDGLLPDRRGERPKQSWRRLLRQAFTLVLLELLLVLGGVGLVQSLSWMLGRWSTALAGLSVVLGGLILLSWLFSQIMALPLLVHERCRALQAMDLSRQLVHRNGFQVLALLGMLLGINLLGLIGATLGLLLSLPFSALVLMACCRPQTPLSNDSRRNMFPT